MARRSLSLYCPKLNRAGTENALTAFLDLLFEERNCQPLANFDENHKSIQASWFEYLHAQHRTQPSQRFTD